MVASDRVTALARDLTDLAPRRLDAEDAAADLLRDRIPGEVDVHEHRFDVREPRFPTCRVAADGEPVDCLPAGLESGEVPPQVAAEGSGVGPRITFDPACPAPSVPSIHPDPVIAVAPGDARDLRDAEIDARLEVAWEERTARNLLAGNRADPDRVVLAHYDSLWGGFIDNAYGVAALVHLLPRLDLDRTLVVFAAAEEVSDDAPYWGRGYRAFADGFPDALGSADRVDLVDSIGRGRTRARDDRWLVERALPLEDGAEVWPRTRVVTGDLDRLAEIYHSRLDTVDALTHPRAVEDLARMLEQ